MDRRYGWDSDLGTLITSDRDSVIRSLQPVMKPYGALQNRHPRREGLPVSEVADEPSDLLVDSMHRHPDIEIDATI